MKVVVNNDKTISLSMVRGDTEAFSIDLTKKDGSNIVDLPFQSGDTVYFTVKKSTRHTEFLLQKIITDFPEGIAFIPINPKDTKFLTYGTYVYDIQVTFADGTVKTIIQKSPFSLLEEVTFD